MVEAVFNPPSRKASEGQGKGYKKIIKSVLGKELIGLFYEAPFDHLPEVSKVKKANPKTFHTVIPTDPMIMPIVITEGTGMVHTAVSAGTEDFTLGKKLGLPMIPVIADDASYLPGFNEFSGKNAKKHPELIIDFLKTHKDGEFLFSTLRYKHRYPACWRCKAELVWKVADEWYIAMDKKSMVDSRKSKENKTLRQRMIAVAKKIKWMPEFGLDRELDWLKNMHDWLISKKNRYWGLALPIYECKKCMTFEVIGSKEELKKRAVLGWENFEGKTPHKPFIDEVVLKCTKCQSKILRINDVGNPWLDAGIVPYSTILENNQGDPLYLSNRKMWKKWFPNHFITESFPGQFKNWFYAMIAMSTVLENTHPFERVLGFATMFGEDGRPMHKSWGNSIEFNEGADKIGVDVMRWMFARQNPADNMLFGYKKTDNVRRQFYLILWNIYKFYMDYSQLEKIKPSKIDLSHLISTRENILDTWILNRLIQVIEIFKNNLLQYNVKDPTIEGERFIQDISTWYIRRSRDRVWVNSEDIADKKSFYDVLYTILIHISIIFSPILPFITDIIFTSLTNEKSVHLSDWPNVDNIRVNENLINEMEVVRSIVEVGHRVRKELQIKLKQPLASVQIVLAKTNLFNKSKSKTELLLLIQQELNVKKIFIEEGGDNTIAIKYQTEMNAQLIHEGKLRDLIRQIQEKRKELGKLPNAFIDLVLPPGYEKDASMISKRVLAKSCSIGEQLLVT